MFSTGDFTSWITTVGAVQFMGTLITAFALLVTAVVYRILGAEPDLAEMPGVSRPGKEPSFREAA